ncbi:ADP-ribosylglycohydrolase family protein [Tolypothrix sp. FACHB-123]|uniref:ADP-ribosylglycohydrolase family protein n=1 Tax=Tolypothrix sp. FACHB-123 TaxID=2692868 RepID=UPI0016856AC3|nr:ADP-ribosylglycohydrolase family protein [Tolypothrix sp. FACHB-123]MBD2354194.1 ADP-ribosylglycohydrolase family protein [Tolypothrix sp. FACHB-123]
MRYSVVSRFRGTLLGALIGQRLASSQEREFPNSYDLDPIAVLGTESLITLGKLDLDDWRCLRQAKPTPQQPASTNLAPTHSTSVKVILATLPVALFFHENPQKLRQNLLHGLKIWEDNPVVRDGTLAVGYAIAQILTEKLHPRTLIPEIIAFIGETSTSLPEQLTKVNTLLDQGASLEQAQTAFSRQEKLAKGIAMAFYCFLSTLEDYRLAVLLAHQQSNIWQQDNWRLHLHSISAITGALSGAYNSIAGIPLGWQILYSQADLATWGLSNFAGMVELADALVAVWSGLYNHALHSEQLDPKGDFSDGEELPLALWSPIPQNSRYNSAFQSQPLSPGWVFAAPRVIRSR